MWKYDIESNVWEYLWGRRSLNSHANYTEPYPGGLSQHAMVIDGVDDALYVFGGWGFNGTDNGINIRCLINGSFVK